MLASLADLVKQGAIGRLEAVNLEQHPEVGQALGVRSVPWLRLGRIELAGVHSKAELAEWAAKADSEAGRVPHQRAVLLIRGHGENGKFHAPIIAPLLSFNQ